MAIGSVGFNSGSGNHFAEFGEFTVENKQLGLGPGTYLARLSHSGSRGTGAQILPKELSKLAWLDLDSSHIQEYWVAMELMDQYASALAAQTDLAEPLAKFFPRLVKMAPRANGRRIEPSVQLSNSSRQSRLTCARVEMNKPPKNATRRWRGAGPLEWRPYDESKNGEGSNRPGSKPDRRSGAGHQLPRREGCQH